MLKKKLKKKKKKRLKEEVSLWEESRRSSDGQNDEPEAVEPPSKRNAADNGKISKAGAGMWAPTWPCPQFCFECATFEWIFSPNPATVVVWDSQVKDGYKRSQAPATDTSKSGDTLTRAAPVAWDGKKTSGVVEELLRNASDKAYGANGEMLRPLKVSSVAVLQVDHLQHSSDVYSFKGYLFVPSSPQLGWGGLCYQ